MELSHPFPKRLKLARRNKGLTQTELGILIGFNIDVSSSRMNHYEKGRHIPDFDTAKRIAAELDVPVAYFYCESEEIAELLLSYHKLTSEQQQRVIAFIREQNEAPSED